MVATAPQSKIRSGNSLQGGVPKIAELVYSNWNDQLWQR